jgi:Kef-type K+ transport system membrane component KefB
MEHELTAQMAHFIIQLAVIFLVARISAEVTENIFKAPGVLGELMVGMIIGPYALGGLIKFPVIGYLFPLPVAGVELCLNIPCELFALAQVSSIILLFLAGLETDLKQFIKYTYPAIMVALGGIIVPFLLGSSLSVLMGFGDSIFDITPLFVGTIMTATSVGITARVLSVIKKMDTPEGVTIMAAAVVDDIAGVLILTGVISIATLGSFSLDEVSAVALKGVAFLIILVIACAFISRFLSKILSYFKSTGSVIVISLGLCFFAAAASEFFGLAMIIGAYIMGLSLSTSEVAPKLREDLEPVFNTFVPIFFVVMGMLVDFSTMRPALIFGILLTILAIIGKVFGSALPALFVGFNNKGAFRIGIGMLPRGEVALIVAGVGLSAGVINRDIFGVSIMMTFITTLLAPIMLVPFFTRGGEGTKAGVRSRTFVDTRGWGEIAFGTSFQRTKAWPQSTIHKWLLIFIDTLEKNGYKKIRSITCPTGNVYTFKNEKRELVTISESETTGKDDAFIRLTSSTIDIDDYISATDSIYNDSVCVKFLDHDEEESP